MEVPGSDSDWRSTQFRQKVVAQIDEAMRKAGPGTTTHKSGTDMENQVYNKAKTRDEYLSLVARLIIHFRDIHKKSLGGPDPMNALTNLTGVGVGPGAIGMGPRPAGAQVGGMGPMGQMQIGQHVMGGVPGNPQGMSTPAQMPMQTMVQQQFQQFQHQQQNQQLQQHQNQQLQQHQNLQQQLQQHQNQQLQLQQAQNQQLQVQQQNQQLQQAQNQQLQLQQQHQNQQLQQAQNQQLQLQQQHQNQQLQHQNQQQQNQMHQVRMFPQLHHPQAQPQSMHPMVHQVQVQPAPGQMPPHSQQQQQQLKAFQQARATMQHSAQIVAPPQLSTPGAAPGQSLSRPTRPVLNPPNASAAPTPSNVVGGQVQHAMISSPSPVQVPTPQMPPPPQPSPQPPTSQPSSVSSGPTPSPGGFQPSPSPQPSPSTATSSRPPQIYSVPSPGPLNTPGNPGSVMSPSLEDQQYMEKLKQLSKYIEPLRRMINKIDKNEDRKKDLSKMKSLLNILTDPNIRCPLKTLQKCEIALEKLKNDMAVPTPPPPPMATKQQYLCQPLLDAIITNIRSPVFNHSLYRTFAPAMSAIHGPPITGPNVSGRKRKLEEDERQTVPNILQGEVARLDVRFLVNLDPSFCSNNGSVHLVCKLDDKNFPSVPPLQLSIPADYPDQSPLWSDDGEQYGANSFLQSVHRNMTSKLLQLPDKHSVTELLNTWAQSVRQACLSAA
ncbi:mediator of RNA polymerase II transcription subunit 15 isoform X3 [Oryzias latipes]|uniref:mediator of RNA polymerase II transcription subunit 15 isoform X3 n=1 Tax=Oryzias latipes TaxID=8090 RepID=UPI000CE28BE4|nr:mediator of RNA polymerase II transcription subunit 15 isoform X3 [Oryzias latipes]